ncbi:MAG TPA: Rieske (2Fe-2S) protein [Aggregatilineales bacterium]|nr:Rieske (2Fe-2S) protein [Aggregatilineales bacterium]
MAKRDTQAAAATKVRVGKASEILSRPCTVVQAGGHTLALFSANDRIFAVDNRCPHMGFPLDRGSVQDGILTCYWHYARFDLASGGTFDLFADDVPSYPVTIEDDGVWVDVAPRGDQYARIALRLRSGLEHDITLVIAKAVIALNDHAEGARDAFRVGLEFGARYSREGWGMGQTIHAVMMNLLPYLDEADRPQAQYIGLSAVADAVSGAPANFRIEPLPRADVDMPTLKRWFRQFVEVRDGEGAERCIATAVAAGATPEVLMDIFISAATDHRYLTVGHVADFTNKAFEALDAVGWDLDTVSLVLTSLVPVYVGAQRQEESNAWRYPIDLVTLLNSAFERIPDALEGGRLLRGTWQGDPETLASVLLGDDPKASADTLLTALADGATEDQLAAVVTYTAIRRMVHFHTSNEFGDWDTVLHTLSYANAIHQSIRRLGNRVTAEALRGVFDAAMSVYLDRFLNIPSAPLPRTTPANHAPDDVSQEFLKLLDHQQEVDAAAELVASYVASGSDLTLFIAVMGQALIREDRDFHTIQTLEAALRQYEYWKGSPAATHALIAAARYLAAHAPTSRAATQTYRIARRLHRGEKVFDG